MARPFLCSFPILTSTLKRKMLKNAINTDIHTQRFLQAICDPLCENQLEVHKAGFHREGHI